MVRQGQKTMFKESGKRTYPMYFWYPYHDKDTTTVTLPAGWHADQLAHSRSLHNGGLLFVSSATANGQTLTLSRDFSLNLMLVGAGGYDAIREFFDAMRASDEDESILDTHDAAAHP